MIRVPNDYRTTEMSLRNGLRNGLNVRITGVQQSFLFLQISLQVSQLLTRLNGWTFSCSKARNISRADA